MRPETPVGASNRKDDYLGRSPSGLEPEPKKAKLVIHNGDSDNDKGAKQEAGHAARRRGLPELFSICQRLLNRTAARPLQAVPPGIVDTANGGGDDDSAGSGSFQKIRNNSDLDSMRRLFRKYDFRTSIVESPRLALSIYKDSCGLDADNLNGERTTREDDNTTESFLSGREFLVIMLGTHPDQDRLEELYTSSIKNLYCLLLFCHRLREACADALLKNDDLGQLVSETEQLLLQNPLDASLTGSSASSFKGAQDRTSREYSELSKMVPSRLSRIIDLTVRADPAVRPEQLQHEYERIAVRNSTLSNAHLQLLVQASSSASSGCCGEGGGWYIRDVYFKRSPVPKYERMTVFLYDPDLDLNRPPQFSFMPALSTVLTAGPETVATNMVECFWSSLLRLGYFAMGNMKAALAPALHRYFLHGIAKDLSVPVRLNAHFEPAFSLSFYLYGKAGSGKSSFARNFSPALNAAVERFVDPEILVRFVKQNLNKRLEVLRLELDLRPNNNDLSVMSIVQGRRCTMGQTKPGLVVLDLEEMADDRPSADPRQIDVARLISQRFSGRRGDFREGETSAPRNSCSRGIGNDASIVPVFTSNYELQDTSQEALQKLQMFHNLLLYKMTAVSGQDRCDLAVAYIRQCIQDRFQRNLKQDDVKINLDIPLGDGDTRPLIRHLRMVSFYTCALFNEDSSFEACGAVETAIAQKDDRCTVTVGNNAATGSNSMIELKVGSMENLYPVTPRFFDPRTEAAVRGLQAALATGGNGASSLSFDYSELSVILDFWLARTLAPAVVVSNNSEVIQAVVATAAAAIPEARCIRQVDAAEYKMMKSLYDPNDVPNLRDDIRRLIGPPGTTTRTAVAVELLCETFDAQLCIREIVEDTPSMTAFSTEKSALYKDGLLFAVYCKGDITPEVKSRASLIL